MEGYVYVRLVLRQITAIAVLKGYMSDLGLIKLGDDDLSGIYTYSHFASI